MSATSRLFRNRKTRGQAAIELALLSIIIVPVFLYILFLDDLLRFKLDQREAMITTGWDFTTLNYDHQSKADYIPTSATIEYTVQTFSRYQFSDHSVATPRFDDLGNNGTHHHMGVGAMECWLVGGKQNQVTCTDADVNAATNFTIDGTVGARPDVAGFLNTTGGNHGGRYSCTGRVGVINHWLPSGTLFFSKEELSSRKYHGVNSSSAISFSGVETDPVGQAEAAANTYQFPADTYSIITNPWAMTDSDNVNPFDSPRLPKALKGVPLYDRTMKVFNSVGPLAAEVLAEKYPLQAISKGLINPLVVIDSPAGDLLATPEVSFTNSFDPKINGFYSSQYWDFSGNDVQKTYNKRGSFYLGSTAIP